MIARYARCGGILLMLALSACGAERAENADSAAAVGREVRACDVLDVRAAREVIGEGAEQPGEDTEPLTCQYVNPGVAMLTVQLAPAEWYDQMIIPEPHTPVQVGDRGRSGAQASGVVAVQFVAGGHSATLSVQPIDPSGGDYLEPLVVAARGMAQRLR